MASPILIGAWEEAEPQPTPQAQQSEEMMSATGIHTLSPSQSHVSIVTLSSDTAGRGVPSNSVAAARPTLSTHHATFPTDRTARLKRWKTRVYESCNAWWYWEVACILLSTACMMAIVILFKADGTALHDWKFMIQPNSLVSVFMTVAKSSLLFPIAECISQAKWIQFARGSHPLIQIQEYDNASRGPWGSLQLLLHYRSRSWIARFGALSTIIALALEPFTQQIIAYPSRQVASESATASQAVVRNLEYIDQIAMDGAALNGIYLANWTSSTANCTTSSCFWPNPIISLGVCGSCRDVTKITNVSCHTSPGPLVPSDGDSWTFETTNCTYSLNGTFSFNTYVQTIHFSSLNGRQAEHASRWTQFKFTARDVADGMGNFIRPNQTYFGTVLAYATYFDERRHPVSKALPDILSPQVFACGLSWCAHVYTNSTVVNGSLVNTNPTASFDLNMTYSTDGEEVIAQTGRAPSNVYQILGPSRQSFPANDTFLVAHARQAKLGIFFNNLFNVRKSNSNEDFSVFPEEDTGLYDISDVIFRDRNISRTFENIASSMTEQVRMSNSSYMVPGVAWDNETYVLVRWPWITLPVAVLCMAVIILVATIRSNHGERRRLWKSSSLALLFHSVLGLQDDERRVESVLKMENTSKTMNAQLWPDGLEFQKGQ